MSPTDSQDQNQPVPSTDPGQLVPPVALGPKKPAEPPDTFVPSGERKEAAIPLKEKVFKEKVPIVEVGVPKEVGPEVKDWMEKLETGEEIQLPQPVTDDATGQVIVDTPAPQKVEIKLPLTEAEIQRGLHQEIVDSIRWLAESCKRLLEKIGRKFVYRVGVGSGE